MGLSDRTRSRKKFIHPKVQITAMMDVLTIILIFLLNTYSNNPENLTLEKGIELPRSNAQLGYKKNISLVLTKQILKLEDEVVGTVANGELEGIDSGKLKDTPMFKKLEGLRRQADQKMAPSLPAKAAGLPEDTAAESSDHILFFCDKGIAFKTINTVVKIAALAGYPNLQFAVLEK